MAAPKRSGLQANVLHDNDANVIASILLAGVRRLRVESVAAAGGIAPLNTFTGAAPTFATIGAASAALVAANAARRWLSITVTTSGNRISLGLEGAAAVLDSGVTIAAFQPAIFNAAGLSLGAINAIANAAGTNVAIQEGS